MKLRHLGTFVLLALSSVACRSAGTADGTDRVAPVPIHHMAPPTEHRLEANAEESNKSRRKSWMRERHWAPPELDTEALERANGKAEIAKRNQLATMSVGTGSRWTEIGSRNQAGRMHVATLGPDGTVLYAGSSKGGVWRGPLNGSGWTPIGDNLYGGAHWLGVVSGATPSDPPVVVAATDNGSIHVSYDDGATWQVPPSLPSTILSVRRIYVTSDGTEQVFIVMRAFSPSLTYSIWRSSDGAVTFTKVRDLGSFAGDLWGPRDGSGPLFAVQSGGTYRSDNNGTSWSFVGPLPVSTSVAELTGSEAGAPRLYAVFSSGGGKELYRSDDAGATWSFRQTVSDYWGTLAASIRNLDLLAWGGVEVWRSDDGGDNFAIVNNWFDYYNDPANKLHADIPGLDVVPYGATREVWYISTDGGLFRSADGMANVANLSLDGLRVSQYYTTLTSTANPNHVVAGAQDQGWQWADQPASSGTSLVNFDQLISGDYGHATSSNGSHQYVYTTYPGFILIHAGENNPQTHSASFPAGETNAWLPPVVADPEDPEHFYFLATQLWRYEKTPGNTWTPTLASAQHFDIDSGEYLSGMVFSPVDPDRVYAVTSRGRLWYSSDKGVTWTQSASSGPGPQYFYGTAITASAVDIDTVWVGGSGYGSPAVWRSTNGGQTFQGWSTGLPSTLVYCLAESPDLNQTLFCGTETGAYMREASSSTWVDITQNDAPVTTYWSVEAVKALDVMRFGTYGRGIWDYDLLESCGYTPYGMALGGANTITLDSPTLGTELNTVHEFHATGTPPDAFGALVVSGFDAADVVFGGTALVSPVSAIFFGMLADQNGEATLAIPVPDDPAFLNVKVYFQALFIDTSQPGDWAFTNGLRGILCAAP